MKNVVLIGISVLIGFNISIAQNIKKLTKQGDKLYKKEHYLHALPIFEQIVESDPQNANATFKKGVCLLNTYRKKQALDILLKAQSLDSEVNKHMDFWLGMAYHSNLAFDKSNEHFKKYESTLAKSDERREDCEWHIQHNNIATGYVESPSDFYIKNLGLTINSYHGDHSPVVSKDGKTLIYTSRRETSTGHKEAPDGDYFEDIFQSELGGDGKTWSQPHSIGKGLNTSGHDASIQLFDNDTKLLMYKYTKGGDFYYSEFADGQWGTPIRMKDINTGYFESDAHISSDGKTMYFSSNRDSKDGNLDLYKSEMTGEGVWGEATPISELNTDYDEDSPYLTPDGNTLYFSSRGRNTMGGYDIFKTEKVGGKWGTPQNMGFPVNSPDDDTYFFMQEDGKTAYMTSFRIGGNGEKDIYMIKAIPQVLVIGEVMDTTGANKGKAIPEVTVTFTNIRDSSIAATGSTYTPMVADSTMSGSTDSTGAVASTTDGVKAESQIPEETGYNVSLMASRSYLIHVIKDGDTLFTEEYAIPMIEDEDTEIEKNFYLAYTDSSEMMVVNADSNATASTGQYNWKIKDIYFDFDKSDIRTDAVPELANAIQVLKAYPDLALKLKVIGHTDSKGSDDYNMKLSKRRATAAADYLVRKGIERSRIIIDFKGESEPIVPNAMPDGSDNPEGRALNRRTEFRFVDTTE